MVTWNSRKKTLTVGAGKRKNILNLEGWQTAPDKAPKDLDRQIWNKEDKIHADVARNHKEDGVQRMSLQEAKALVRPSPKHYKGYKTKHKRIPSKELLRKMIEDQSLNMNEEGGDGFAPVSRSRPCDCTTLPGEMPREGAVHGVGGEELEAQRKLLQELKGDKIGATVSTIMDMEQGFHQIRVALRDQYKTAFRTCMGKYESKVMRFGFKEAPGTFQAGMMHMFLPCIGKGVIASLDDLLICSKDVESHAKLLKEVMKILEENKMHQKYPSIPLDAIKLSIWLYCEWEGGYSQ
ncbi:hypothetical protein Efla_004292 [Eimeria flavescens]